MWQAFLDAIQAAWDWFLTLLISMGQWCISAIIALLPQSFTDSIQQSGSVIGFALSAANAWLPLDLLFTFMMLYAVFVLSFLAIKVLIKLIP